jgi:Tol biopolymer transport system component
VSSARWRPKTADGFVFSKDIGGGEFFELYWRDAANGNTTLLTDGKSRNTGGVFSRDGSLMAYESTRRNKKDDDVYVMSPTDPKSERRILEVYGGGWPMTRGMASARRRMPTSSSSRPSDFSRNIC